MKLKKHLYDIVDKLYNSHHPFYRIWTDAGRMFSKNILTALIAVTIGGWCYFGLTAVWAQEMARESPEHTKIAFTSDKNGNYEIYVMNPDGSKQKNLTNNPGWDANASWSPDGKKIAFVSRRDGHAAEGLRILGPLSKNERLKHIRLLDRIKVFEVQFVEQVAVIGEHQFVIPHVPSPTV